MISGPLASRKASDAFVVPSEKMHEEVFFPIVTCLLCLLQTKKEPAKMRSVAFLKICRGVDKIRACRPEKIIDSEIQVRQ